MKKSRKLIVDKKYQFGFAAPLTAASGAVITLVIVARPGDPSSLSEKHRAIELGPRDRRPLDEVVAWNRFAFADPPPA